MSDINLVRRHSLPIPEAKARVQKVADELAAEHDLSSEWAGNTIRFHRLGLHGEMQVTASKILLEVTLGFLLKPLRGTLVDHIDRKLDKVVPEPKPARKISPASR